MITEVIDSGATITLVDTLFDATTRNIDVEKTSGILLRIKGEVLEFYIPVTGEHYDLIFSEINPPASVSAQDLQNKITLIIDKVPASYIEADNFNDLDTNNPAAANTGQLAYVESSQGTPWLPGGLGGTYRPAGWYLSDGVSWTSDRNAIAQQLQNNIDDISTHTANTSNPHSTNFVNIGAGTISQLNAKITDANLDDSGQPRTPTGTAAGDLAGTYPSPTIKTGAVTNAKAANMAANTVKVNATGISATAQDLAIPSSTFLARLSTGNIVAATVAQVKTLIGLFSSSLSGLVPASGGGTTNFLRADGTWSPPNSYVFVGPIVFASSVSPIPLVLDTNNWTIPGLSAASVIYASSIGNVEVTGINSAGLVDGQTFFFYNKLISGEIKFKANNASSSAGNRFLTDGDIAIKAGMGVIFTFDGISNNFRVNYFK